MRPLLLALIFLIASPPMFVAGEEFAGRQQFGMNLAGVVDWTREWALVDVFKHSRQWMFKGPDMLTRDDNGYPLLKPGQSVDTLMLREINGNYPEGLYVCTYEGQGKLELKRWDVKQVVRQESGRIEVQVQPAHGGLQLAILESDPQDPLRNIHVWMPGFEGSKSSFHPLYVERLKPFGVLRFMDWQRTNGSPLEKWEQRAQPEHARYSTPAGMPLELMIELANTSQAHPWFCLPHQADDDFVRRFAQMVQTTLRPELKVYVELSNEVWNGQFEQARYARQRGKELGLSDNEYQAQLRWYSQRAVAVFKIWEEVFGGRERLVRVMASQSANPWVSEQVLTWQEAWRHCDALGIAPYFGNQFGSPQAAEETTRLSVEELLDRLKDEVAGRNRQTIEKQAAMAGQYKLQLVAYEGGQHLVGHGGAENNEALMNLFHAANRHPRMFDLYQQHLANWFDNGGGLFVVFSNVGRPSKWGSWGVLEHQDQLLDAAPKYRAILDGIRRRSEEESRKKPAGVRTARTGGRVVFGDGTPVVGATVAMTRTGQKPFQSSGVTDRNGEFALSTFTVNDGAVPGIYELSIIDSQSRPLALVYGVTQVTVIPGPNIFSIRVKHP